MRICRFALTVLITASAALAEAPVPVRRLAVATFSHETCTFCPQPTGIAEWEFYGPPRRGEEVLREPGYIQGFVATAKEYDGVSLTGILSPRDAKGGSSGSWITREAFDKYANGIAGDIRATGPYDGVFLALHGAMAVTDIPRPEAELARRVRAVVGPKVPILITLDLHANEDQALAEVADAVFIVKRYPHYDEALQGERAARLMMRILKGTYRPVMAVRKPGVLTPSVFQGTGASPALEIMERARVWEERTKDLYVSVAFGFAYADVPDIGATVMVVANADKALAERVAQDMSDFIWKRREAFAGKKLPKVPEGVAQAIADARGGKIPVVVADHADRTGDATHILAELMKQGARRFCVATLADPAALERLAKRKAGDAVSLALGGTGDAFAGKPVRVEGVLERIGPWQSHASVAVIRFGDGNRVILTPVLHQVTGPGIFRDLKIPEAEQEILVIKSRVHFWRGFVEDGLAKSVVVIDAPGLGPADVTTIPYRQVPRNLFPILRQ